MVDISPDKQIASKRSKERRIALVDKIELYLASRRFFVDKESTICLDGIVYLDLNNRRFGDG